MLKLVVVVRVLMAHALEVLALQVVRVVVQPVEAAAADRSNG